MNFKEYTNINKIEKDLEKVEKRSAIMSRIFVADENNPIFQALSTWINKKIIELESKVEAPAFLYAAGSLSEKPFRNFYGRSDNFPKSFRGNLVCYLQNFHPSS